MQLWYQPPPGPPQRGWLHPAALREGCKGSDWALLSRPRVWNVAKGLASVLLQMRSKVRCRVEEGRQTRGTGANVGGAGGRKRLGAGIQMFPLGWR